MDTVYWVSLIVGGFFVLLSALGGGDTDADVDVDVDADADLDFDADADLDADADAAASTAPLCRNDTAPRARIRRPQSTTNTTCWLRSSW